MAAVGLSILSGCGAPRAPDIRARTQEAVATLGVHPIYPFNESTRVGAVHLIALDNAGLRPWQEQSVLLTEALVNPFSEALSERPALRNRLPQSPNDLPTSLRPDGTAAAFYRQRANTPATASPEGSLPLAAMPGFTMASVDQASFAAFVPDVVASIFASLGLRRTTFQRMEAEGIEVAELPLDALLSRLRSACVGDSGALRERGRDSDPLVREGHQILAAQRQGDLPRDGVRVALLRRVFYLRGVRFVIQDSSAAAALARASLANPVASGRGLVPLPTVTVNNSTAPPAAPTTSANSGPSAAIGALQAELAQLRNELASGGNINLGMSFARATATGVELVQLFDRPLAFGHQSILVNPFYGPVAEQTNARRFGLGALCDRVVAPPAPAASSAGEASP